MSRQVRRRILRLLIGTRRVASFCLLLGLLFIGVGTNWPRLVDGWASNDGITLIECMDKYAKLGLTLFCIGLAGFIVPIPFGAQYKGYKNLCDKGYLSKREYERAKRAMLEAELSSLK